MTKRQLKKLKKKQSKISPKAFELQQILKPNNMTDPQLDVTKQGYSVSGTNY